MSCERCGREGPVDRLAFHQHIGLVVLFLHSRYAATMCRFCADELFKRRTIITAIFGWWGVLSVFLTPITIGINLINYFLARGLPYPDPNAVAHGGGGEARDLSFGPTAVIMSLWAFLLWMAGAVFFIATFASAPVMALIVLNAFVLADLVIVPVTAIHVLGRSRRVAPGTPGRFRFVLVAITSLVRVVAFLAAAAILQYSAIRSAGDVNSLLPWGGEAGPSASLDMIRGQFATQALFIAFVVTEGIAIVAGLVHTVGALTTWWLVPRKLRMILWLVVDSVLVFALSALWGAYLTTHVFGVGEYRMPLFFVEPLDDPTNSQFWPVMRLAVTTLVGMRVLFRLVPVMLNGVEKLGFRGLVAARMLRARKSGFLTIIGALSILAVTVSTCMLTMTLSIMGGFREDLKQKLIGNNAHVVVDRERGTIEEWGPMLVRVRGSEGVVAATPYVNGEVMITSSTNLSGAILRGIDPATISDVTDLRRNMTHGRIEYLTHPERLLRLRPEETGRSLLFPSGPERGEPPSEAPENERGSIFGDVEEAAEENDDDAPAPPQENENEPPPEQIPSELDGFLLDDEDGPTVRPFAPPPEPEVLPGVIVGQELARTLRLHVGDEVDVVSPFGELGPSGMMPKTRPFRVAGIFYSGMYEFDMKMAYVTLEDAQRFLNVGGAIHGIEVKVEDAERAEPVARGIAQRLPRRGLRVRSWQEVNRNLFGALQLEKLAMFITLGIAILVASFCVVGSLTLMVQEKAREVGILKAMGATGEQIVAVFMAQGLMIGLLGAIVGLGLGYVACFWAEHFGIALNPEVYYIDRLPVFIDPTEFALVGVAAVVVCLLATIYPALLGSRLRPVDALRDA